MERLKAMIAQVLLISLGVVVGGGILFLLKGGVAYLPCLDAMIDPVVSIGPATNIYRDDKKLCFGLPEVKLTDGLPLKYEFWVQTTYSPKIGLSAYLANNDNTPRGNPALIPHPKGAKWTTRYCAELPGTISDAQELTITGHALHNRHWGWKTETPVPTFNVAALPQH